MSEVQLLDVQTKVAKESHEIGLALNKVCKAIKDAKKDGWQWGQDIPSVVLSSLQPLMSAVDGYEKLPDEYKKELGAAMRGLLVPITDIPEMFIKKEVTE
jgi:hypothetical protein